MQRGKCPNDKGQAGCKLFSKFFDITAMGEAALKSDTKGAKHMELEKLAAGAQAIASAMRDWFRPDTPSSSSASSQLLRRLFCTPQSTSSFRLSLVVHTA